MAFILGFPANETVVPIIIMAYSSLSSLQSLSGAEIAALFTANGSTPLTALCVMIFTLLHWTLLSVALPTVCGALLCLLITTPRVRLAASECA